MSCLKTCARKLGTPGRFLEICMTATAQCVSAKSVPDYLRRVVEELGGGIIKLAQILALRYDLLPQRYCDALAPLFEDVRPMSADDLRRVFAEEFGRHPEEIFQHFSYIPVASASFGQVHKAALDNLTVAVKVQRPEAAALSQKDIRIVKLLALLIRPLRLAPGLFVKDIVREWQEWTQRELNYIQEAVNAERLRALDTDPDIYIPKIIWRYTTNRILCEEFLVGRSINALIRSGGVTPSQRATLARRIVLAPLRQYFVHGFTHADLHPGNLLLLEDGRLGFVDFGIMSEAVPTHRAFACFVHEALSDNFTDALRHFLEFMESGVLGAKAERALRSVRFPHGLSYRAFQKRALAVLEQKFNRIMKRWMHSSTNAHLSVKEKSTARYFLDLLFLANKYGMAAPANVVSFIRTLIIVDMVCLALDPGFNMAGIVKEFFRSRPELTQKTEAEEELLVWTSSEVGVPEFALGDTTERAREAWMVYNEKRHERRMMLQERYLEQASRALEKMLERSAAGLALLSSSFSKKPAGSTTISPVA